MNLFDYLFENCPGDRDIALLTPAAEYSYGDLRRAAWTVAQFLKDSGAAQGDRVLLLAENSFFWVASYLGTLRAGCVCVPVAPDVGSVELKEIIRSCSISFGMVHGKVNRDQAEALGPMQKIVWEGSVCSIGEQTSKLVRFSDLPAARHSRDGAYPEIDDRQDLAAIMFTSGSTNVPRGVMVSHGNIIANTDSIIEYLRLTSQDRVMVVLPFYYCFGTSLLHTHLRAGASLVLDPRFMFPDKVLATMQQTECTGFAGVPSHYQLLLRQSNLKKMQFPRLRYVQQAGGKLADSFIEELQAAIPSTQVFVMYGQTEATARLSYLPPHLLEQKRGSIGKGLVGTRITVVDDNGTPVLPGQVGEVVAEGDNIACGYWNAPEETGRRFRGGRLFTGDLATVDEDGFIFIVDRSTDVLKCGGRRCSSKQVEDTLLEFDGLIEAAVVAVPDEILGEAVKAFVVPRNNDASLVERLQAFCIGRLPSHLLPKRIVVLDELPKTQAGKVLKPALRSMA